MICTNVQFWKDKHSQVSECKEQEQAITRRGCAKKTKKTLELCKNYFKIWLNFFPQKLIDPQVLHSKKQAEQTGPSYAHSLQPRGCTLKFQTHKFFKE